MGSVLERGALDQLVQASRSNILATYSGLASSVPGAKVSTEDGFLLSQGPSDLAFCNFAAGMAWDSDSYAARGLDLLADHLNDHPAASVFLITGDQPATLENLMIRRGFTLRHLLNQMAWLPGSVRPAEEEAVLTPAIGMPDRRSVARFMTDQFFSRGLPDAKTRIADATSRSPHELWSIGSPQNPRGGVMFVETPGALGLYNLCIEPGLRKRGMGGQIIRAAQTRAALSNRALVLQCEDGLARWYRRYGFEIFGHVGSWRLHEPFA